MCMGEMDKRTKVIFAGNAYKNLEKLAPLWNAKTGNSTALVFIDSEVVSASCDPNASSSALERTTCRDAQAQEEGNGSGLQQTLL
ncbi:uncharacterized protein CEXT_95381 [Caerostris extrusa]|uniref:Uncharacterized protein n=1 Tax=Caerostris extrusa TaxID=172846 RepID=A0AAV4U529_CAEEX|nr:uncharacterized protein CEXT_95381 [Caerostris extrusa]